MSYESRAIETGAGNRFREEIGRYFEEFNVGDVYEHRPGRTINEADNSWFTLLTMNTHPFISIQNTQKIASLVRFW